MQQLQNKKLQTIIRVKNGRSMKQKDVILRSYLSDSERYADLWNAYLGKEMFEAQELEVMDAVGIQKGDRGVLGWNKKFKRTFKTRELSRRI